MNVPDEVDEPLEPTPPHERIDAAIAPAAPVPAPVPGQGRFGPSIDRFDRYVDEALERVRGIALTDALFTTATHLGDFSVIWHLVGLGRATAGGRSRARQSLVLSALLGVESITVNQGMKRLFDRQRPTPAGDSRFLVRRPVTTSFPSGHSSSAAFAAAALTAWDGKRSIPLWGLMAGTVAISRAYVRIHHASDVVGGALTGLALAGVVRPLVRHLRTG